MRKDFFVCETSPLDYWEHWIPLNEFDSHLIEFIRRYPKLPKSYTEMWDEINSIILNVHKHTSELRSNDIYIYIQYRICEYIQSLVIWVGVKEDNNGTCVAFAFDPILIDNKIPLPHDFGCDWEHRTTSKTDLPTPR